MGASILRVGEGSQGYPRARSAARGSLLRFLARLVPARAGWLKKTESGDRSRPARGPERGYGGELPDPVLAQAELHRSRAWGCGTDFPR